MEILPSDYQELDLNKSEKLFLRYAGKDEEYGFLFLKINPAIIQGEYLHAVITSQGIIFCKILETVNNAKIFPIFIDSYYSGIITDSINIIGKKLTSNKALIESDGLALRATYVCIFPSINRKDVDLSLLSNDTRNFVEKNCMFKDEFAELRSNYTGSLNSYLKDPIFPHSKKCLEINDLNINSILNSIAPEYTIVRFALKNDSNATPGASEELLVVSEDDIAVRAYRLDQEQINIVNKITKGDQLILACAGSGKSVLLIAKCFKAAQMNPNKRFLITCYNRNLYSLYTWFIERAGLRERNVDCMTFDGLCKKLLTNNNLPVVSSGDKPIERRRTDTINALRNGKIKDRYYGIFIDEVQMFDTSWYQLCFNLLENKDNDDHLFVVCGDKTQEIQREVRNNKAPWHAGEGYPDFKGSNCNIRIEKNFRNCIEINEYINRFAENARRVIQEHIPNEEYDPDMFLRGQAFRHGDGVTIKKIIGNAMAEADAVVDSIKFIHDHEQVPYDEIAVTFFNRQYTPCHYYIEAALNQKIMDAGIPFVKLYSNDDEWAGHYGDGGVSMITFGTVLGLDYKAVIVCGLIPLGAYDKTKKLLPGKELKEKSAEALKKNISSLYVACTRAKDYLHIILTEDANKSIFSKLLIDSYEGM